MKTDFKKTIPEFYAPKSKEFTLVDVPEMSFLMIDGKGDPNTSLAYRDALETLYPVAYKTKFISKKQLDNDYVVPSLEGLWWAKDMSSFGENLDKSQWSWTMMIMQPEWITAEILEEAKGQVAKKCSAELLSKLRFEKYAEGLSLQCMHIGSYDDEAPKLHHLHHQLMPEQGFDFNGKHHEIYLNDPRRTAPEKLKTILRQPVKEV
jgi:hypothetical protein